LQLIGQIFLTEHTFARLPLPVSQKYGAVYILDLFSAAFSLDTGPVPKSEWVGREREVNPADHSRS